MQKKKLKTIEYEKRRRPSVYLFYGLRSDKEVKCPRQITGGTLATKSTFQNSPNGKRTSGKNKITYPSIYRMFWDFQSYIVIYFILESKSFCWKWVFNFTFYSFEKMSFHSIFWVFQVNEGSWLRFKLFLSFSSLELNIKSTERCLHFLHAH